ncbi:branched-chain amino acid ABC transporter substrate-binding protein [Nocardioides sp. HM23]|uniref:branched-chain amino acid ABC transporter substrate-binding protein n=1 Tax=Nocardioides bizhenqiangii TaxID=3095076 RepID=UPI002ACA8E6C|nr:branched-chain amino acid ABC transporter substrate-binding protein [Nocardioides sp. HM23]MDZ5620554.1 branched-chain amino acid ABC transporter substrate-binding protein [Nocardioides sp. HM23]
MDKRIAVIVGIVQVGVLTACGTDESADRPESRGELTIYSSLPLQGDSRPQSEDIVRAFELALDEREGRAGGYDIKYVSLDDADPEVGSWTPERVAANAWEAANDPSTVAYLGDFNSDATMVSLPILNDAGIAQVSPSNTYAGLTRGDGGGGEPDVYYSSGKRTYARVVPADHVQAGALVGEMRERECSTVFIVHHDETYGLGLADAVERSAADAGLDVVGRVTLDEPGSFGQVRSAAPDCLLFAGITMDGATQVANDAGQALPELRMFFPDGCAELAFTDGIDEEVEDRVFLTNPTLDELEFPAAGQRFYRDFQEVYGHDPEPYAIYGYEAMSLVLDAIDRAGDDAGSDDAGRAAVVEAVFGTKDRESVLGTYDIDDYGDTTLTAYGAYAVLDGAVAFDHVIEPVVVEPTTGPEITDPPAPPTEETTEAEEPGAASPIEGTWQGGEVTEAMVAEEWGRKAARFVFEANGAEQHLASILELHGDVWQALVSVDGGPAEPAQEGTFSVQGDRILFEETGLASYEYRYTLEGDTLRITLVGSDAAPAAPGVPDDVFQFAHLEAAPFRKVG